MGFDYASFKEMVFWQDYRLSKLMEYAEASLYSLLAFSLPFAMGHSQILIGSAVNCVLVLAALNLRGFMLLPVVVLPSVGLMASGMVFGNLSHSLVYMLPFIWAANSAFVFMVKKSAWERAGGGFKMLPMAFKPAAVKAAFLFAVAFALFQLGLVPQVFLAAFGINQFITAAIGAAAAIKLHEAKKFLYVK